MSIGKGFQGILAVAKESAYGTAVEVTEPIPFVSERFEYELTKHEDNVLRGKAGRGAHEAGNRRYPFAVPCVLTYEDLDLLIAVAMGGAGTPDANGGLYDNTYSLAEALAYSFTCAIAKQVSVWEYAGCKIDEMAIRGQANAPLDIEFSGVAKNLSRASATNTNAVLTALDTEDDAGKVMMSDLTFKIAAQGDALATEDELGLSGFELRLQNSLQMDGYDNRSVNILEPLRNGFRAVTLSVDVPRYEADTYMAWHAAQTPLHASLAFTSGNYAFTVNLPKLLIDTCAIPVQGPQLLTQRVEMTAYRDPDSDSASFTVTDEMEIQVTNGRSASPLA